MTHKVNESKKKKKKPEGGSLESHFNSAEEASPKSHKWFSACKP